MKRISFIIALQVIFSISAFAQLNKFEGTWVKKDVQMRIDIDTDRNERRESRDADRWHYFRFDIKGSNILIRHKVNYKFFSTGVEQTCYYSVKDIVVHTDNTVTCDIFFPPEMGKTYYAKTTPHNRYYNKLVEHSKYKFKIVDAVLIVESGPIIRDFYSNGQLVETDYDSEESYVYRSEYYNEKDNW